MQDTRTVSVNGIDLLVREQGHGPLVLLCHGWPELSYSWRHQIPALANAGFHVVAPDMRGFGRSSAPAELDAYSIFDLVGDMVALAASYGASRAAIVGHDWGAAVAWHAALFRPDLFCGVAGLSVPPPYRGRERPLDSLHKQGIKNFYWQYFQPPGVAEAEFERDPDRTLRTIYAGGFADSAALFVTPGEGLLPRAQPAPPLPEWLDENDLAEFVSGFRAGGFRGGLNWYRNLDRNWDLTAPWQDAQIRQPSLFIAGAQDAVVTGLIGGKRIAEMERVLPALTRKLIIPEAGHWIQQERPGEVNAALVEFLKKLEF